MAVDKSVRAVVLMSLDPVDVNLGEGAAVVLALSFGQLSQDLLHEQVLFVSQAAPALRADSLTFHEQPEACNKQHKIKEVRNMQIGGPFQQISAQVIKNIVSSLFLKSIPPFLVSGLPQNVRSSALSPLAPSKLRVEGAISSPVNSSVLTKTRVPLIVRL